jgi:hypothetical protein
MKVTDVSRIAGRSLRIAPEYINKEVQDNSKYTPIEKAIIAGALKGSDLHTRISTAYHIYKTNKLAKKLRKFEEDNKLPSTVDPRDSANFAEVPANLNSDIDEGKTFVFFGHYKRDEVPIIQGPFYDKSELKTFLASLKTGEYDCRVYNIKSKQLLDILYANYITEYKLARDSKLGREKQLALTKAKYQQWAKSKEGSSTLRYLENQKEDAVLLGVIAGIAISSLIVTKIMLKKSNRNLKMAIISGCIILGLPILLGTAFGALSTYQGKKYINNKLLT